MPDVDLDFEVLRGDGKKAAFRLHADPNNSAVLSDALRGWLRGNHWHKDLWSQFSADVRLAGKNKVVAKVRP